MHFLNYYSNGKYNYKIYIKLKIFDLINKIFEYLFNYINVKRYYSISF